jgi:hypothetical protein
MRGISGPSKAGAPSCQVRRIRCSPWPCQRLVFSTNSRERAIPRVAAMSSAVRGAGRRHSVEVSGSPGRALDGSHCRPAVVRQDLGWHRCRVR